MEASLEDRAEEKIKIITGKEIKRALLGRWGKEKDIPKSEAAFLLVKAGLAESSPQAKETLDWLSETYRKHSVSSGVIIYDQGETYRVERF